VPEQLVIKGVFASKRMTLKKIGLPARDDAPIIEDRTGIEHSGFSSLDQKSKRAVANGC
jgi:hypothetical protein